MESLSQGLNAFKEDFVAEIQHSKIDKSPGKTNRSEFCETMSNDRTNYWKSYHIFVQNQKGLFVSASLLGQFFLLPLKLSI